MSIRALIAGSLPTLDQESLLVERCDGASNLPSLYIDNHADLLLKLVSSGVDAERVGEHQRSLSLPRSL